MILTDEDRDLIAGALDGLAVALSTHDHEWTEGERAIYEEALRVIGADPDDLEDPNPWDDKGEEWKS